MFWKRPPLWCINLNENDNWSFSFSSRLLLAWRDLEIGFSVRPLVRLSVRQHLRKSQYSNSFTKNYKDYSKDT